MGGGDWLNRRDNRNGEVSATLMLPNPIFIPKELPMAKSTSLQISIRPNNPRGYIITCYRISAPSKRPVPVMHHPEENYFANNIEEVESMIAQLLRRGKVT